MTNKSLGYLYMLFGIIKKITAVTIISYLLLFVILSTALSSDNIEVNTPLMQNQVSQDTSGDNAEQYPSSDILLAGCEYSYPPFCFADEKGNAAGFSVELLKMVCETVGLKVKFKTDYWNILKSELRSGELDILPLVGKTPERERIFNFTDPYTTNYGAIFIKNGDSSIKSVSDLSGKNVAVMKGDTAEEYVRKYDITSNLILLDTYSEAFRLLSNGNCDAVVAQYYMGKNLLDELEITNIKIVGKLLFDFRQDFCFAVRKGDNKLASFLNNGLSQIIASGKYDSLYEKWFPDNVKYTDGIVLSPEERSWINTHPVIRLGFNPYMEPLLIRKQDGSLSGIFPDIIYEINHLLGVNIDIVVDDWSTIIQQAKSREIDGLLANAPSQSEACNLIRANPILSSYPIVYTRHDAPFTIDSLDDLVGKKIAYQNSVKMLEMRLLEYKDKCELITTNGTLQAYKLLLEEKVDAVMAINFENYLAVKHGITGIKIAYYDLEHQSSAATGIRDDWPELVEIINKGINLIGHDKINKIVSNYSGYNIKTEKELLNASEKKWIKEHPVIKLGFTPQIEPLLIKKADGSLEGMLPELVDELNSLLGVNIEIVPGKWSDIVEQAKQREIDGLLAHDESQAANSRLLRSNPMHSVYPVIYSREGESFSISRLEDVSGKKITYQKGVKMIENRLGKFEGQCSLFPVDDTLNAFKLLLEGKVDLVVSTNIENFLVSKYSITGVKIVYYDIRHEEPIAIGIRDDWPEFINIINKGFDYIGSSHIQQLIAKWTQIDSGFSKVTLNQDELIWISEHPDLKIGFPVDMPPYSFRNDKGENKGLFHDYLKIVNNRLGTNIKPVLLDWPGVLNSAKNKDIDLISGVKTDSRSQYLKFSDKFFEVKFVVIARNDAPFIKDVSWLKGKKITIMNKLVVHDYLLKNYPDMDFIPVDTVVDGLKQVSYGQADVFIGDSVSAGYNIMHLGLSNLKIAASVMCPNDLVRYGVRDDYPELVSIINKALESITEKEHSAIVNKWMSVRYEQVTDWYEVTKWICIALVAPVSGLILVIFWNRQLNRSVHMRTIELEQANKFTVDAINSLQDVFLVFNPRNNKPILWNNAMKEFTGYQDNEILHNALPSSYLNQEDTITACQAIEKAIDDGIAYCELEVIAKDGSITPTSFVVTRVDNPDGSFDRLVVVGRDITDRRATEKELEKHRQHLEELVEERAEELNKRNKELIDAMAKLKDTQAQLILFEKLGALKHLVSGIAHEINSPLGAINSSREILENNLKRITDNVKLISDSLEGDNGPVMGEIINNCFINRTTGNTLSPREKRAARDNITSILEDNEVHLATQVSQKLIELHIYNNVEYMLPLLKEDNVLEKLNSVGNIIESVIACDTIELAVHKASKIVNALNKYIRKGGNGDREAVQDIVDIKESIDNVLTLFYNAIKYTVTLDFECDDKLPDVLGDSDEINQVWTNLIKNALDAMEGAGYLTIRAKSQDDGIMVSIKDSGCGMTDDVKARVFEPLFTTKSAGEGTGLGMDIVHKIVTENHGGRIEIDSTPGKGTTIYVWLPQANERQ